MRTRDVTIPLGLWICAAIGAHFLFGTGGLVVAQVHDDRSELWALARQASNLAMQADQTFDLSLGDSNGESAPPPPPTAPPVVPPLPKTAPTASVTPPKAPDAERKVDKRIALVEKKVDEKPPAVLPPEPLKDRRIAVRQHAAPNQDDNPNANYIADDANHVDHETRATQTSHDRDDLAPTPGGNHPGSDPQPGDSERTRIAENEKRAGEKNRAPGERGTDFDVLHEPRIPKSGTATPSRLVATFRTNTDETGSSRPASQEPNHSEAASPGSAAAASPEVESASGDNWTFNPAREGPQAGAAPGQAPGSEGASLPGGKMWSLPGLGQSGPPGALNTNLGISQVAAVVGSDNLTRLREADGERRRSEHRGSWIASNFDRWRTAIENYVSTVKPGNQTALNAARSPFATYLNGMHNRIHPIFADTFLTSLDGLPSNHPLNDQTLVTLLEIVLTPTGHLKKMGVVKTSGVTAFDIAALDAVDRAQPFGPPPKAIISGDGNVYLQWEFHRDEVYACSTMGARPYILPSPGGDHEQPPQPAQPPPARGRERNVPVESNDAREGALAMPRKRHAT
jgi:TonB family protein